MTDHSETPPTPEEQKAAFAQAIAELTAVFEGQMRVEFDHFQIESGKEPELDDGYDLVYRVATEHPPTMLRIAAWSFIGLDLLGLAAGGDPEEAKRILRELALNRAT